MALQYALLLGCIPVTALMAQALSGTISLERNGDLAIEMVAGIDHYLMRELERAAAQKGNPSRDELKSMLGIREENLLSSKPVKIGESEGNVSRVRWAVVPGLFAEGVLLHPTRAKKGSVVVLTDAGADDSPVARRMAAEGYVVLVPILIDRRDTWSGNPAVKMTNQPHREWLHRQLFPVGKHIIGVEVQKVLAALEWFGEGKKVELRGTGEGGLVAMMAAALDDRFSRVTITGAFEPRERVWSQPIYRSIWGQLRSHGDAEIVSLIRAEKIVIQGTDYPEMDGAPTATNDRRGAAPGKLVAPLRDAVEREFSKVRNSAVRLSFEESAGESQAFPGYPLQLSRYQQNAVEEMTEYAQRLVRQSDRERLKFAQGKDQTALRQYLWEEVLGKLPDPAGALHAETRVIYDEPSYTGYEIYLPVLGEVYAYGILLVPKDLKAEERRPVVVTQHGLDGRPQFLVKAADERQKTVYQEYAARLAQEGFIVYAPQNPYIGDETFRVLLRKATPLKLSLFSFIIAQHQRTLEWLKTLSFVDPSRIGFYGLSYGGKTAMRVPSLLDDYALSICSGDFNEWIWKITSIDAPFSYMFTKEYDMLEWNLANTFNYAEMAALISPRPFMVERGHRDPVGIDEWVAYEYAKVRRAYDEAGLGHRTAIEFFNGQHQIHGAGTFEFLRQHLNWRRK